MFNNNYFPTKKNKHQKKISTHLEDDMDTSGGYIDSPRDLPHHNFNDLDFETEVQGNIHDMRRQFKSTAKRLRGLYASE